MPLRHLRFQTGRPTKKKERAQREREKQRNMKRRDELKMETKGDEERTKGLREPEQSQINRTIKGKVERRVTNFSGEKL